MKKLTFAFLALMLLTKCSNDDNNQSQENILDGGVVNKFQIVHIEFENLLEESYNATVGANSVTFFRTDSNHLSFMVDDNFSLGEQLVEIPSLNTKISYNIEDTILTNSVDETVTSFTQVFNDEISDYGDSDEELFASNAITTYSNAIQQMNSEDREIIAKIYQANQSYFDTLYSIDYSIPQTQNRSTANYDNLSNLQLAKNWALAVFGAGASTYLAVSFVGTPQPLLALPFVMAAVPLYAISYDMWTEMTNRSPRYVQVIFDNITSTFDTANRNSNSSSIEFINGNTKSVNFDLTSRNFNNSDNSSSNNNVVDFLSSFNEFNNIINKLNDAIIFVNTLPLINVPTIDNLGFGNTIEQTSDATAEIFNNFSFSLTDPNLEIENAISFDNGNINITLNIIDETIVTDYIETQINYSYSDDFNDFSGSFPIKVLKQIEFSYSGNWYKGIFTLNEYPTNPICIHPSGQDLGLSSDIYFFVTTISNESKCFMYVNSSSVSNFGNIYKEVNFNSSNNGYTFFFAEFSDDNGTQYATRSFDVGLMKTENNTLIHNDSGYHTSSNGSECEDIVFSHLIDVTNVNNLGSSLPPELDTNTIQILTNLIEDSDLYEYEN